jgi:hypothetical protein
VSAKKQRFVFISNPYPNGKNYTTAKRAREYVVRGWARWVGSDRIEFNACEARERSQMALPRTTTWPGDDIGQALALFGPAGLAAVDRRRNSFQPPPEKAPGFDQPGRLVASDQLNMPKKSSPRGKATIGAFLGGTCLQKFAMEASRAKASQNSPASHSSNLNLPLRPPLRAA